MINPDQKTIASVFVSDTSAGVATLMLVNDCAVLMSLWAPTEDDDRILKAACKSSPDQYILNPNPRSKDESFFADQLKRLGNKDVQILEPFHIEAGMEVLREMLAMKELLCNSCDGWPELSKKLENKKAEKPPQLMALLQALVFLKQAANQPEIGFGMALAGQPARSQSRQQSEQAGTAGFGMRLGGGRRGRYDHWVRRGDRLI